LGRKKTVTECLGQQGGGKARSEEKGEIIPQRKKKGASAGNVRTEKRSNPVTNRVRKRPRVSNSQKRRVSAAKKKKLGQPVEEGRSHLKLLKKEA